MDKRRPHHPTFGESVAASFLGGIPFAVAGGLVASSWVVAGCAALLWIVAVALVARMARRRVLVFIPPMSWRAARRRIESASDEIWSLQISGSEFTAHSVETYEKWLDEDKNRCLKIAFVNPDNAELLASIVKLSGIDRISYDGEACRHLREVTVTSLNRYIDLRERFADQVDARIYDSSPPFSIHAVDPHASRRSSRAVFVELYLPNLPSRERPCLRLDGRHSAFSLYRDQSNDWFESSEKAPSAPYLKGADGVADPTF
jgi:hypothetical protein